MHMKRQKSGQARRTDSVREIDGNMFSETKTAAEKLRFLLHYAILAPSNHNTQPWLFDLNGDRIELRADRSRSLHATDEFDREMIISCGAALAFLEAAATGFGCELRIDRFPDRSDSNLLARISLTGECGSSSNPKIIESILNRRTNRNAFDPTPIPADEKQILQLSTDQHGVTLTWIDDPEDRKRLAQMIMDADKIQFENPSFLRELAFWIRAPQTDADDGIPAKAVGISGLASYVAPFVVRTFDLGDGKAARDEQLMHGSPGIATFSTPFDEERDWLACGEALGSFLLAAEQFSLRVSYLNQPCEVNEIRFRLSLLDSIKGNPQLVLRLGYTEKRVVPTPRRKLQDVLR